MQLLQEKKYADAVAALNAAIAKDPSWSEPYVAKGEALKRALDRVFTVARAHQWPEKAVVFTESKRTHISAAESKPESSRASSGALGPAALSRCASGITRLRLSSVHLAECCVPRNNDAVRVANRP